MKGHLKKSEAVKVLVKRSVSAVRTRHLTKTTDDVVSCPPQLVGAVQHINTMLSDVKNRLDRDEPVLQPSLEHLSDDQLSTLLNIFDARGGQTEDKLFSSTYVLAKDEMDYLDKAEEYINFLRGDLVATFLRAYGQEYHLLRASNLYFNNDEFKKTIRDVIAYRRGIRRSVENDVPLEPEGGNQCLIM
eukprot:Skav217061  [mRNA]  locus=scaffold208:286136:286699:- [translate_table: standard]